MRLFLMHIARRFSCVRIGFVYDALPNTKRFFTPQCLLSYLLLLYFQAFSLTRGELAYSRIKLKYYPPLLLSYPRGFEPRLPLGYKTHYSHEPWVGYSIINNKQLIQKTFLCGAWGFEPQDSWFRIMG